MPSVLGKAGGKDRRTEGPKDLGPKPRAPPRQVTPEQQHNRDRRDDPMSRNPVPVQSPKGDEEDGYRNEEGEHPGKSKRARVAVLDGGREPLGAAVRDEAQQRVRTDHDGGLDPAA